MSAEAVFDAAIVGGALAGAAAARALAGLRVALVSREARPLAPGAALDARIYAISPGNADFLRRLGAWDAIPEAAKTPVRAMRVFGDDGASRLEFDAYRTGAAELAWIVEDGRLQDALWRGLEAQDGLALRAGASIRDLRIGPDAAVLALEDGRELRARLVIGADGARSVVRERAGLAGEASEYGHSAVVANFACTKPHRHVAWQWFRAAGREGVLALLPLPGEQVSMVWSVPAHEAARLLALEPEALAREVGAASRDAVGELAVVTPPRPFPLRRFAAPRLVAPRVALVGDAAHVVHPLAGQGLNLGLQDVASLLDVLRGREPWRDLGDMPLLRRHERARAEPVGAMRWTVNSLARLFSAQDPLVRRLRNAGLGWVEAAGPLKSALVRRAIG